MLRDISQSIGTCLTLALCVKTGLDGVPVEVILGWPRFNITAPFDVIGFFVVTNLSRLLPQETLELANSVSVKRWSKKFLAIFGTSVALSKSFFNLKISRLV